MTRVVLEDIIDYVETQLRTIPKLDIVRYVDSDTQDFPVKMYGAKIYVDNTDVFSQQFQHIGKIATEFWKIHIDIIINRRLDSRVSVSDTMGISYWINTIRALFQNGTNGNEFRNSWWEFTGTDPSQDGYVIMGNFNCEILNIYS